MSNRGLVSCQLGKDSHEETASVVEAGAFWAVWLLHQEYLSRLSLRWMQGNRSEAEEALSSAKLKAALYYLSSPDSILDERAWLSRLLHNVCVDIYRRRGFMEQSGVENFEILVELSLATGSEASPENAIVWRELHSWIRGALRELPAAWRSAFIEHCLKERSYREIASEKGLAEANVRKRVQLARARLRQLFRADFLVAFTNKPL